MTLHATPRQPAPETVERQLEEAAESRRRQLDACPPPGGDLVLAAHRDSVARILGEIRAAQARLARGTYGSCLRCGTRIPTERLEARPWTAFCLACADR